MGDKILTLHPEGKQGVNLDRTKYDAVRGAILDVLSSEGVVAFADLSERVAVLLPDFDGSYGWYTTTVKLDLEARGEIERLPGRGSQKLRRSS